MRVREKEALLFPTVYSLVARLLTLGTKKDLAG